MIHSLKKGKIVLSNWIEDSKLNWMKHRILDYSEPMDVIRILKLGYDSKWYIHFEGKNIEHVAYTYKKVYGDLPFLVGEIPTVKENVDTLLSKIDKLIAFI